MNVACSHAERLREELKSLAQELQLRTQEVAEKQHQADEAAAAAQDAVDAQARGCHIIDRLGGLAKPTTCLSAGCLQRLRVRCAFNKQREAADTQAGLAALSCWAYHPHLGKIT